MAHCLENPPSMQPRDAHGGTPDGGDSWLRRATAVLSTYRLRVFVAQPDSNALQPPRSPHVPSDVRHCQARFHIRCCVASNEPVLNFSFLYFNMFLYHITSGRLGPSDPQLQ